MAISVGADPSNRWPVAGTRPAVSTTTRIGDRASAKRASRTVSEGSSAIAVPAPTTTASAQARNRCTSARDPSPVIHREEPSAAAVLPSRLDGHLQGDVREAARDMPFERPVEAARLGGHHTEFDLDAGVAELERGRECPRRRFGSVVATTTRATPASISARVQGGVRPKWLHGSSVQTTVAPRARSPGCGERHHLGVRGAGPFVPAFAEHRAVAIVDDEGAHHGIGRDPAPAAFGELERPPHLGLSCLSPRVASFGPAEAWRTESVRRCDSRRAHSAAPSSRSPVPFHPDSHGRPRSSTGSTHRWLRQGRGLSPPVGSCTPPRKRLVVCPSVYGARQGSR